MTAFGTSYVDSIRLQVDILHVKARGPSAGTTLRGYGQSATINLYSDIYTRYSREYTMEKLCVKDFRCKIKLGEVTDALQTCRIGDRDLTDGGIRAAMKTELIGKLRTSTSTDANT